MALGPNTIAVGFINVVATPHPTGVYVNALREISNKPVQFRGNDWAVVLAPEQNPEDSALYEGRISVWTDIDSTEPSIDKETFEKKDVEDELKRVFAARGFNNRTFSYVLDEQTHKLAVELQNELGKTISIRQADKIFYLLLTTLNREGQTYETTIIPDEDAISVVLGLKRLDKLTIVLKRPNPGDHDGGDADDVLRELDEQNMKEADYVFSRQPGTDGIRLNERNRTRAEVAAQNGYVESSGIDGNGERAAPSTKEYPRIVRRTLTAGTAFIIALRNEARRFRGR